MKKLLFVLILPLFIISTASGQSTELSAHLNGGLFSFGGHSATKQSVVIISDVNTIDNRINNPYGSKNTFSYGLAVQLQRITSGNLLLGGQLGYERLRSEVDINNVAGEFPPGAEPTASGESTLLFDFITLHPNIGYRFQIQPFDLDLTVGPDFAFYLNSQEKAEVGQDEENMLKVDHKGDDPGTDIRIRTQAELYYRHWGVSAGYSYGLHNYKSGYLGGSPEIYSRFIRFGISYRF